MGSDMRVLMVTPYLGATYGGTSKVVQALADSLGQLGVSVDVITTNANDANTLDVDTQIWVDKGTYRIRYFPCWHRGDFIVSGDLTSWLVRHLREYDLIHTHTLFAPLVSFVHKLCRWLRVPYMMTPHGMLDPWALAYKAWKKRSYYAWFEQTALRYASAIQALSSTEASQIHTLGFDQTVVVPNGIHRQDFDPLQTPDIFYQQFPELRGKTLILFLGRIDPKKGLDLLAPAFAQARTANSHLVVAGPDSIGFMSTAQQYFAQAGCLDQLTFTGMLNGALKQSALAAADIYVAPSYSEGFSMSVLEGMAAGLPCVLTTGCNFPEAAAAQVAHVVTIEMDALAQALEVCLKNLPKAKTMGAKARDFIFQNYTWETAAKKLIKTYVAVI